MFNDSNFWITTPLVNINVEFFNFFYQYQKVTTAGERLAVLGFLHWSFCFSDVVKRHCLCPIQLSLFPVNEDIVEFLYDGVLSVEYDLVGLDWGVTLKRGGERDLVRLF